MADRIDDLEPVAWRCATDTGGLFLRPEYLSALEAARPANLEPRYVQVFQGREPLAALALQRVRVDGRRARSWGSRLGLLALRRLRLLVCGNLLSWGASGASFTPGAASHLRWPAVLEAIRWLDSTADLIVIKDLPPDTPAAPRLRRAGYRCWPTDPDMVLTLRPEWRCIDDYLAALKTRYRRAARRDGERLRKAGLRVRRGVDPRRFGVAIPTLYGRMASEQSMRLVTPSPTYLSTLARALGDDFRCTVIHRPGDLRVSAIVGFVTTLRDGDTAVAYHLALDGRSPVRQALYPQLLRASLADALDWGCRRLTLGRTALDAKARLGARPRPLTIWARPCNPALGWWLRRRLDTAPATAPSRRPFRTTESSH